MSASEYLIDKRQYSAHDIHSLVLSGVSIFNIDRNIHSEQYFVDIKSAIKGAQKIPEIHPSQYYTPVTLAITMSIESPVAVDEDVDIVILKNVKNLPQYLNFKDNNLCEILKPILVWISSGTLTDGLKEIIRLQKPIFHLKPDTTLDYYSLRESKRSVFIEINEVVNSCVDGIVISDDLKSEFPPKEIVRSIIRAMALETLDNSGIVADYLETGLFNSGANLVVLAQTKESIGYCNGFQIINVPFKCESD
ncbi:unnamed protein product [Leptidea sinapis]|uniref:Uncharacterized protein n=1 Tax=Leptidea sinapis TaxID=189913 RepID=A0A5E4QUD2_9NEOP|nr:unnamed protein product [Leptidea sinapis]